MSGGALEFVQDAVICIFFTVSAALLLTNALARREPSILSNIAQHGNANIYIVYGPTSSVSNAFTVLFVLVVINGVLFAISTTVIASSLLSGPTGYSSSKATPALTGGAGMCRYKCLWSEFDLINIIQALL
jgi:hypothetical protein